MPSPTEQHIKNIKSPSIQKNYKNNLSQPLLLYAHAPQQILIYSNKYSCISINAQPTHPTLIHPIVYFTLQLKHLTLINIARIFTPV